MVAEDEFLDVLEAGDGVVRAGFVLGVVEMLAEGFGEDAVDEGRFPGAGRAGDDDDLVEGDFDGEVAEVVLPRADYGDFRF